MAASIESIGQGTTLGWGASNARMADVNHAGLVVPSWTVQTPKTPREFFDLMEREVIASSERGNQWVVAGFPGLVSVDGRRIGPMENISGLSDQYDLVTGLSERSEEARELLSEGFQVRAVNDGELAAQAAAHHVSEGKHDSVAAFIVGTGVGTGIVRKDLSISGTAVYRGDAKNPAEIGHIWLSDDPTDTLERAIQGSALRRKTGMNPKDIPSDHPIWEDFAVLVGRGIMTLAVMHGPKLVVPTGGVGAGASDKYKDLLLKNMTRLDHVADLPKPQKVLKPEIGFVDPRNSHEFELHGGPGVMLDFVTR